MHYAGVLCGSIEAWFCITLECCAALLFALPLSGTFNFGGTLCCIRAFVGQACKMKRALEEFRDTSLPYPIAPFFTYFAFFRRICLLLPFL